LPLPESDGHAHHGVKSEADQKGSENAEQNLLESLWNHPPPLWHKDGMLRQQNEFRQSGTQVKGTPASQGAAVIEPEKRNLLGKTQGVNGDNRIGKQQAEPIGYSLTVMEFQTNPV
jgi:hypothetical protein